MVILVDLDKTLRHHFDGKTVAVTGGTGSIGSMLVRRLLELSPRVIRVLSNDENGQFFLQQSLKKYDNARFLVGDIRDKDRLVRAFENCDIVFNAAALKHVPLCEYNPFEAVKTNVLGTQNVIEAALANNVSQVAHISTDKVVNAINTMGATKLLSEKLVVAANQYKGMHEISFFCIRLGNVLGSQGSLVHLIADQLARGDVPAITDHNMTRFVVNKKRVVDTILRTATITKSGEIFVLKMPAVNVIDLIQVIIEELRPSRKKPNKLMKIENTGKRVGEKLHEELMTKYEYERAVELKDMYVIPSELEKHKIIPKPTAELSSEFVPKLSREAIRKLIKDILPEFKALQK